MKTKTERILAIMNVLAYLALIGLLIKAGAILTSYIVSLRNPEGAKNLYLGLNLYTLKEFSFWHYSLNVLLLIALPLFEAFVAYLVIKVLTKIKLENPFTADVSDILERISYFIFGTWIIALFYNEHTGMMLKKIPGLSENKVSTEFIFLAGVVFVFAQIFKKGVEIQSENELTV
jgi:Protein of unknown function (DUF2975)